MRAFFGAIVVTLLWELMLIVLTVTYVFSTDILTMDVIWMFLLGSVTAPLVGLGWFLQRYGNN